MTKKIFMRKYFFIIVICAVLISTIMVLCGCNGTEPTYYGTYHSGTNSARETITFNKDGMYVGTEQDYYTHKTDYTYNNGVLHNSVVGSLYLYEDDEVIVGDLNSAQGTTDQFYVRNGFFNNTIRFMQNYTITNFIEFNDDGTYIICKIEPLTKVTGTYTLNNGVLIFTVQTKYGPGVIHDIGDKMYAYIDSDFNFYTIAYIKHPELFEGNGIDTQEPEPEPNPGIYYLNYLADEGGNVEGETFQTIYENGSGLTVTAIADEGFTFIGWSDGVLTAERTDENITANLTVTAQFEKIPEYTLTYKAQEGGYLEGETTQTVQQKESGTAVKAVAKEGYTFIGWSDGVLTAERTEQNVTENISVTAMFESDAVPKFAGGCGTADDPYLIETERHLKNISYDPLAHYQLMNDIVFGKVADGQSNFIPLFNDEIMFNGILDGSGFSIKNLTVCNKDTQYAGLFACIGENGIVHNLTIENAKMCGVNYVGGIAGYSLGSITNCRITGMITNLPGSSSSVYIGGIVGFLRSSLNGCSAEVTVNANGLNTTNNLALACIGGVAGYCANDSVGKTSYTAISDSIISVVSDGNRDLYVGGIFGCAGGLFDGAYFMELQNCYSTGEITIVTEDSYLYDTIFVGGIAGYSIAMMNDCYANCSIAIDSNMDTFPQGSIHAGGLIGKSDNVLTNCYAIGDLKLNGKNEVCGGGLIGFSFGEIINCYSTDDITVNNCTMINAGGLCGVTFRSVVNCYSTGNVEIKNCNYNVDAGGLIGVGFSTESEITNSYTVSYVSCEGSVDCSMRIGAVAGSLSRKLKNVHWLYFAESGVENAVGYDNSLGISTSSGSTSHMTIEEFYTLANTLNQGQENPVWEHKTENSLPTLIKIYNS